MSVKNTGCGCLTIITSWLAIWFAASTVKSCYNSYTAPKINPSVNNPNATAEFVKKQLETEEKKKPQNTTFIPAGTFTIDLLSQKGPDKRFVFNIKNKNRQNEIFMNIKEIGSANSSLGGMVRFNIVYWDPSRPNQNGLFFQISFNDERGCFIRPPEDDLKTIYIANNERTSAGFTASHTLYFSSALPNLKKTRILNHSMIKLPERFHSILPQVIQMHNLSGKPLETFVQNQHTR